MVLPKHGMWVPNKEMGLVIEKLGLEREYRRAVIAQQTMAERAARWQADILPVR
jgi:hypothetical protein